MLLLQEKLQITVDKQKEMKKYTLLLLLIFNINLFSQEVLLEIENEKVSLDEFTHIFNKNNDNEQINKQYLDEYIELFINFKLKVKEAKNLRI